MSYKHGSMNTTVALETLGCKVNQYESAYLLETLEEAGYRRVSFRERADVYIVHSCAVTSRAGFQTRQLLRRAQRINPQALVVVAGCDAQLEAGRLANERLATHILGTTEKFDLLRWLQVAGSVSKPCHAVGDTNHPGTFRPLSVAHMHSGRARAFLKVQDGCDAFCSYCVVPYVRGRSRSLPLEGVRSQMDQFLNHGYQEVVLTGIHLGQWGKDFEPSQNLAALLRFLDKDPVPAHVRLSSLEPMEWSDELIGQLASHPWICPHFHVPLQSGDEEILKRMHRPYTPRQYSDIVQELRHLFPDAALGADVLVGFPGESEQNFQNTLQLIAQLPLTYLHVFPFSVRPGTPAALLPKRISSVELKHRAQALQDLAAEKKRAFGMRFLGRWIEVMAETEVKRRWWKGTSGNYLQILFHTSHALQLGTLVKVHVTQMTEAGLVGESPSTVE